MWQKDRNADAGRAAAWRTERACPLHGGVREPIEGFLEHISLVMDTEKGEVRRGGVDSSHAASPQGAGVRNSLSPRLGGRALPAPARHWMIRGAPALEEERRLAHVGLTRSGAPAGGNRTSPRTGACTAYGHQDIPSRFLDELPERTWRSRNPAAASPATAMWAPHASTR